MAGGGAAAKWFLKKGKNDGKGFGILWESELRQQQLLPLLETFSVSARARPQPIAASAERPRPGGVRDPRRQGGSAPPRAGQLSLPEAEAWSSPHRGGRGVPASSW